MSLFEGPKIVKVMSLFEGPKIVEVMSLLEGPELQKLIIVMEGHLEPMPMIFMEGHLEPMPMIFVQSLFLIWNLVHSFFFLLESSPLLFLFVNVMPRRHAFFLLSYMTPPSYVYVLYSIRVKGAELSCVIQANLFGSRNMMV